MGGRSLFRPSLRRLAMLFVIVLIATVIGPFAWVISHREHLRAERELCEALTATARLYAGFLGTEAVTQARLDVLPADDWPPLVYLAVIDADGRRIADRTTRHTRPGRAALLRGLVPDRRDGVPTEVEEFQPAGFFHEEGHLFQAAVPLAPAGASGRFVLCVANSRAANVAVAEAMRFVWLWAAVALAGGVVVIYGVDLILRRNVRRLIAGTERIAVGHFDERVTVHTGDDLERLGTAFNRMAEAVQSRERELDRTRATLQSIFDGIRAGITYVARDGRIIMANKFQGELFERAPASFLGKFCYREFEKREEACAHCPGTVAMRERRSASVETEAVLDDGRRVAVHIDAYPVIDAQGEVNGFIEYVRDVTEQKRLERELQRHSERLEELVEARTAELHCSQAQVVHAEKMASIGLMAAGIAHEIGNPLTALRSVLAALEDTAEVRAAPARWALVRNQVERIARTVQDLVGFARPASHTRRPEDLNALVESVVGLARFQQTTGRIEIAAEYDRTLGRVETVADQFQQVLLNVLLNAFDAQGETGGTVRVRTARKSDHALVEVTDRGPGIPPEHLPRLFEPLFTTKPPGRGTGLGLAVSYALMGTLGGTITAENRAEGGACFRLTLPLRAAPTAEERAS